MNKKNYIDRVSEILLRGAIRSKATKIAMANRIVAESRAEGIEPKKKQLVKILDGSRTTRYRAASEIIGKEMN